jgi:predicted dehydrogenase
MTREQKNKKKCIGVGSIGLGSISRGVHLPGIARSEDFKLVALCDIDPKALKAAQEQYNIPDSHCFTDYRDLINCPDVDAVDIATPNDCHFEIAYASAEAGKPYALEKPITMTKEEADKLAEITKAKDLKSMVCFSYRFKPAARYVKDIIDRGLIGDIYHVNMQYLQAGGIDTDRPLTWRYIRNRAGSGALGDLGSHGIDLVRFVTGKEYKKVIGHADTFVKERKVPGSDTVGKVDVDDFCNYMAEMEGQTSASFQITRFAYGRGNYQRMEIYGSKGAIVYHLDATPNTDEIEVCIGEVSREAQLFTKLPVPHKFKADQMQSFADIINGKDDGLAATIFDGQKNQHVLDAIIESVDKGEWVTL